MPLLDIAPRVRSANYGVTVPPRRPGRCGRESPCEQLCFELHDGMFECECREGYVLHLNGYGCLVRFRIKQTVLELNLHLIFVPLPRPYDWIEIFQRHSCNNILLEPKT
ncbi:EGF-containing fibulin-like extracellular matrix protein 2 [Frankliniella fusca]|uniref:EGF-containing fibulin-like extracellular matrix protein 2 n=1 Tax=Frankliniella fusca TaxID=407009 RepID=A0AAE1H9R0_9NEOP|nr:EGF-containing fibulin-like extracellular matrix protein 2 [Frankliniella fusca]